MTAELQPQTASIGCDVLIVGAAGAGLRAALAARRAGADVLVLSKMGPDDANCTTRAWGGFTYATAANEEELFRQVVETGGGLNNQRLVEVFVRETPKRVTELAEFGVRLEVLDEADARGRLGIVKIPGKGNTTGFGMTRPLRAAAEALGVRFADNVMVSRLLLAGGRVAGAAAVRLQEGELVHIAAPAVVLATGGGACLYGRTDNPAGTTGDGMALACEAGADLVDMECVSFTFPKDRVEELLELDPETVPAEEFMRVGGAHYFLGGVAIDEHCQTTVPGLYAAGEVTGGPFGAARLGGAALADVVVFGAIAGEEAARWAADNGPPALDGASVEEERRRLEVMLADGGAPAADLTAQLQDVMWRHCGTMKTRRTLERAEQELARRRELAPEVRVSTAAGLRQGIEWLNMLTVAELVTAASQLREETRGCFWRIDFPKPDAAWIKNIRLRQADGRLQSEIRPATMTRMTSLTRPRIGAGCFGYLP